MFVGFQTSIVILDLYGVPFHAVVVLVLTNWSIIYCVEPKCPYLSIASSFHSNSCQKASTFIIISFDSVISYIKFPKKEKLSFSYREIHKKNVKIWNEITQPVSAMMTVSSKELYATSSGPDKSLRKWFLPSVPKTHK